jgi:hypothetical protein
MDDTLNGKLEKTIDKYIDNTGIACGPGSNWQEDRDSLVKELSTVIEANTIPKDKVREIVESLIKILVARMLAEMLETNRARSFEDETLKGLYTIYLKEEATKLLKDLI